MLIMPQTCVLVYQGPDNEIYFSNFKSINARMEADAYMNPSIHIEGEITQPHKYQQQLLSFDLTENDILDMLRSGLNEQNYYSS